MQSCSSAGRLAEENSEYSQLISSDSPLDVRVSPQRWVVLFIFAIVGFTQSLVWNTWGSVSSSVKEVYPNWTDSTIALMSNWGYITYVIFLLPVIWFVNIKGLRMSALLAGFLVFVGAGVRCLSTDPYIATWFIHIGQFLNGIAGIIVFSVPPQLSAVWFPPSQRTTATGLIYFANNLGMACGSLIGPVLVSDPESRINPTPTPAFIELERHQIFRLLIYEFVLASFGFLCMLIHFPEKPRYPPSFTASIERTGFVEGMKFLCTNWNIWMLTLAYSAATSIFGCWVSVMHISLQLLDISQKEAGWLGCYATLGGSFGSILASRMCDKLLRNELASHKYFHYPRAKKCKTWCWMTTEVMMIHLFTDCMGGRMKTFLTVAVILSTACFLWFALLCIKVLPYTPASLYLSVILGGTINTGAQPVFMELGAELGYPVGEYIIGGFISGIYNAIGMIFLLVFFIPNLGYMWMNWSLVAVTLAAIPFLSVIKERYNRSDIDHQHQSNLHSSTLN